MLTSLREGIIISVCFWLVGAAVFAGGHLLMKPSTPIDVPASSWQAVFLSNGQVYFGKLHDDGREYLTLRSVYYLREAGDLQQSNLNLVKLGGELHGPEDAIHIRKDAVLFWENMKETSRVVQTIQASQQ